MPLSRLATLETSWLSNSDSSSSVTRRLSRPPRLGSSGGPFCRSGLKPARDSPPVAQMLTFTRCQPQKRGAALGHLHNPFHAPLPQAQARTPGPYLSCVQEEEDPWCSRTPRVAPQQGRKGLPPPGGSSDTAHGMQEASLVYCAVQAQTPLHTVGFASSLLLERGNPPRGPFRPCRRPHRHSARTHTRARRVRDTQSRHTDEGPGGPLALSSPQPTGPHNTHTHSREGLPGGERHSSTNAQWTRLLHHRQKSWLADKKSPMPTRHVVMQVLAFTTAADAPSRGFPPEEQKDPKTCCAALCTSVWCLAITA